MDSRNQTNHSATIKDGVNSTTSGHGPGRPTRPTRPTRCTRCTRSLLEEILATIRQRGLSGSAAAVLCGVSAASIFRWKYQHPALSLN